MKRSSIKTWLGFTVAALVAVGGLSWLSAVLLRFEQDREASEARERLHADLRLAVWRIDSLLAPVLTEEAARPPDQYRSFYPLFRSYDAGGGSNTAGEVLVPSPILKPPSDWAVLNFQLNPDGSVESPQVPPKKLQAQALANGVQPEEISVQERRLDSLASSLDKNDLERQLDDVLKPRAEGAARENWFVFNDPPTVVFPSPKQTLGQWKQGKQQIEDFNARQRAMNRYAGQASQENVFQNPSVKTAETAAAVVSHLVPLWVGGRGAASPSLVLVRRVRREGREFLQGVLVDWPKFTAMAREEVRDLFPEARLVPRNRDADDDPDRTLAVLPAKLEPGRRPEADPGPAWTPVRIGLLSIWAAFLCGTLVVGAGLRSLLALNHRRLDFVSAVTHELRTPLTTFRMYAEMLKDGMVPEGKSQDYFVTLHEESQRLSHLVQNVLDYSRLESNRLTPKREKARVRTHLERILPTLDERCVRKGAGFRAPEDAALEGDATLDASALGQILFNLVDNACKYGDGEVALSVTRAVDRIRFTVSDQGGGIEGAEARQIFSPFARGRNSEERGPGVGLGLALCRRWAREMGGDLRLEDGEGTRFVLDLPAR